MSATLASSSPSSAAAALSPIDGPCHRPSMRNTLAGSMPPGVAAAGRLAKLTSKLARTARSPTFSSSRRRCSSQSRSARERMVHVLRAASLAAEMRMASGSPAQASEQLSRGVRLGRRTRRPHDAAEQRERLMIVEHVQMDEATTNQVRQAVPAGDDDGAGSAAGQQRPDLRRVSRVVEHDQHPLPVQPGPVQGGALAPLRPGSAHPVPRGPGGTGPAPQPCSAAGNWRPGDPRRAARPGMQIGSGARHGSPGSSYRGHPHRPRGQREPPPDSHPGTAGRTTARHAAHAR